MGHKRVLQLGLLLGLVGVGVGAFFLQRYLTRPTVRPDIPEGTPARSRDAIPVPAVRFRDSTTAAGIAFTHTPGLSGKKLLPETMGSGVACLDFDNDGKQDLLFVNSGAWPGAEAKEAQATPKLYRNKGGVFEDVTEALGLKVPLYGLGVTVGDFDNDGFVDVFISCVGRHRLFRNEQGKRFHDVTDAAGVGVGRLPAVSRVDFLQWKEPIPFGSSCTFLDYDGDGRLDLFVCHYITWSPRIDQDIEQSLSGGKRAYVQPREFDGAYSRLFRNVDGTRFEDVTEATGIGVFDTEGIAVKGRKRPVGKSLGVVVCDPDNDGWPDLLVANDTVRNFFFHNVAAADGKRRFDEVGLLKGAAYADEGKPRGGMGIDWGEYDTGRFAAVIANFANEPNTFLTLKNPKKLHFSDAATSVWMAGPSRVPLKFGAMFFDYDLDGRLDLLTCNGHIEPEIADIQNGQQHAQSVQLFWNTGQAERIFEPATAQDAGGDLFAPLVGRGCAFADIDNDGDLDVVLTANGGPARLLRNDYQGKHGWIRLHLKGDGKRSNRSAIGADVKIEVGGRVLRRQITAGRGYLSQSELPLTVGLDSATKVDRVTVRWPGRDHQEESWTDLEGGRTHDLIQGSR